MKSYLIITTCAVGLMIGGCVSQTPPPQQEQAVPQPSQEVYYYQYNWRGPGWYSGIYFNNEGYYRRWHRRHRRHHHRRYHHDHRHHDRRHHRRGRR